MQTPLEISASGAVMAMIADFRRTEDVRFSPDGRRIALAGFARDCLFVLDVDLSRAAEDRVVHLSGCQVVRCRALREPHGVDFIDADHVAVANRKGRVTLLRLPAPVTGTADCTTRAIRQIRGGFFSAVRSPGSVAVTAVVDGQRTLIVCNNYRHHVTEHRIDAAPPFTAKAHRILLKHSLAVPDGVAISHDGSRIAISNHNTQEVLLFDRSAPLDADTAPVGHLRGLAYPHGLRFTRDDSLLLVADAGAPSVCVFARGEGWQGRHMPERTVRVMDETTFRAGRYNPQEGGPKGMDIDPDEQVMVVTSEFQPLTFLNLPRLLKAWPEGKPAVTGAQ